MESGEGIERKTPARSVAAEAGSVESGEGIESSRFCHNINLKTFCTWNPVKELKAELQPPEPRPESRHVESGEGIESSPPPRRGGARQRKWNPVKELKV